MGNGLFTLSVLAKTDIALTGVTFSINSGATNGEEHISRMRDPVFGARQNLEVQLSGQASDLRLQLVDATGGRISDTVALERIAEGSYLAVLTPQAERFRILVTGADGSAWPFERMYPVLFRAQPPK